MTTLLSPKYTTESELITFDFTPVMVSGETISTVAVSATTLEGGDASPSAILSGSASISGYKVTQRIAGGTTQNTYRIVCTATTSVPNIYTLTADLYVISPSTRL